MLARAQPAEIECTPLPARPAPPPGPYVVAGLGRAGRAAVGALSRLAGPDAVVAWDRAVTKETRRVQRALEARGVRTHLGHEVPTVAGPLPARSRSCRRFRGTHRTFLRHIRARFAAHS